MCAWTLSAVRGIAPESAASVRARRAFGVLRARGEVKRRSAAPLREGSASATHAFSRWRQLHTLRVCAATCAALVVDYGHVRGLTLAIRSWRQFGVLRTVFTSWRDSTSA